MPHYDDAHMPFRRRFRAACVVILMASFFSLCAVKASAEFFPSAFSAETTKQVAVIVNVWAPPGHSEFANEARKLIVESPIAPALATEHIQKIAADYLVKFLDPVLKDKITILSPPALNPPPTDQDTFVVQINVGFDQLEIEKQKHTVGVITVNLFRPNPGGDASSIFYRTDGTFHSARMFPAEGDPQQVQKSVERATQAIMAEVESIIDIQDPKTMDR